MKLIDAPSLVDLNFLAATCRRCVHTCCLQFEFMRQIATTKYFCNNSDFHMSHKEICCSNLLRCRVTAMCCIVSQPSFMTLQYKTCIHSQKVPCENKHGCVCCSQIYHHQTFRQFSAFAFCNILQMAACNQTLPSESQLLNNMAKRRRRLQQWYGTRKVNSPLDGVLDQCRVITPTPTPTSLLPCTIYLQGRCPFKGLSLEQP